jgi:signal transduction histidine kinase
VLALSRLRVPVLSRSTASRIPAGPRDTLAIAGAWLLACALTFGLASYISRAVFVFFWGAVLFAAWRRGLWAGVLAAVAAVLAVDLLVLPPLYALQLPDLAEVLTLSIFVIVSAAISALAAGQAQARALADEQAARLQEQAVELELQADAAQAVAMELELASERLRQAATDAETARADAERAREAAEAANRAKSQFLSTMSHELRTPLNAIAGYTELLELEVRGPVTDEQREDLTRIRRSAKVLMSLVNDVLNFARIEAGQVAVQLEVVPLAEVLVELEVMIEPQLRAKRLRYVLDTEGAHPVRADVDRLRQILTNVLTNAIKFTPVGGVIRVSCDAPSDPPAAPPMARVRIGDSGRGIPADRLQSIFEPFVQIDRHLTVDSQQGVGLGLAISRDLARAMGGDLTVESVVGEGSVFTLALPRADVAPSADRRLPVAG